MLVFNSMSLSCHSLPWALQPADLCTLTLAEIQKHHHFSWSKNNQWNTVQCQKIENKVLERFLTRRSKIILSLSTICFSRSTWSTKSEEILSRKPDSVKSSQKICAQLHKTKKVSVLWVFCSAKSEMISPSLSATTVVQSRLVTILLLSSWHHFLAALDAAANHSFDLNLNWNLFCFSHFFNLLLTEEFLFFLLLFRLRTSHWKRHRISDQLQDEATYLAAADTRPSLLTVPPASHCTTSLTSAVCSLVSPVEIRHFSSELHFLPTTKAFLLFEFAKRSNWAFRGGGR